MNQAKRRVVVTGIGLITPLGIGLKENWSNLIAGKSGIKQLNSEEYKNMPSRIAGQIDRDQLVDSLIKSNVIRKSDLKTMSWANIFALGSADQALKDSEWQANTEQDQIRAGTSIATGMAGMSETADAAIALNSKNSKGYKSISPYFVPRILPNLSAGLISIKYKLKGPNHCVTTACAAGTHAIADAYEFIKNGLVDVMICGASEACIHPVSVGGFSIMRALATKFNDKPEEASRPFDKERDGFVMSEGSACLVLESLDHVKQRKAESKIYAEILGSGFNADANHITNPCTDGDGAFRCMKLALENSNIKPEDVSYINAHATSTPAGDIAEITAIKRLFSNSKQTINHSVYISSLKGSIGHLLGAAGAAESAFTVLALKETILPPTINLNTIDPALNLDEMPFLKIVQNQKFTLEKSTQRLIALKNSFGFGGTNAALCLSNFIE